MVYKGSANLLPRCTGPHKIIRIGRECANIDQHDVRNTATFNQLTGVAKEERPKMKLMSIAST